MISFDPTCKIKGDVIFLRIKEPSIKSSIEDKKRRNLIDMLNCQLLRKIGTKIEKNLEELKTLALRSVKRPGRIH